MNPSSPLPNLPRSPLLAAAALLGWFALALQLWLSIRMTTADGRSVISAVWIYLGFFTVLTNLLVATALSADALGMDDRLGRFFRRPGVTTAIAANIAVVMLTYNTLLRQLWQPQGWNLVADLLLHDVMPAVFLLFWWFAVPKDTLRLRQLGGWLLYPLGYLLYALIRGAVTRWYPYPFLDVNTLGYPSVWLNAAGVALVFIVMALLLLGLAHLQRRGSKRPSIAR
ncbi:Pr6Pr family membrane protein [Rhodanobacter sp. L36]|uniref:Pr6Pr family membrane protein n=1 Tax=Rhodanobacter sp. L36 TaxID=1747221 RepID=UPI00131CA013|nr:Pr6Pr family membrane protein [Rhodanobacter sp. L36]